MLKMISGLIAVVRTWVRGKARSAKPSDVPIFGPSLLSMNRSWWALPDAISKNTAALTKLHTVYNSRLLSDMSLTTDMHAKAFTGTKLRQASCRECGLRTGQHKLDCSAGRSAKPETQFAVGDRVQRKDGSDKSTVLDRCDLIGRRNGHGRSLFVRLDNGGGGAYISEMDLIHIDVEEPLARPSRPLVVGDRVRRVPAIDGCQKGRIEMLGKWDAGVRKFVVAWDVPGRSHELISETKLAYDGDHQCDDGDRHEHQFSCTCCHGGPCPQHDEGIKHCVTCDKTIGDKFVDL